jgi:hypothetical protein
VADFALALSSEHAVATTAATARLAQRFPEVEVVGQYRCDDTGDELWICRAPSIAHVERWVAETAVRITSISRMSEP